MKKAALLFFFILFFCSDVFCAQTEKRAFFKGIRPMSMGGAFVAVADDENAFFYNPAGITQRTGHLGQFFSFDGAATGNLSEFTKFVFNNRKELIDFEDLPPEEQTSFLQKINNEILGNRPHVTLSLPDFAFIFAPEISEYSSKNYFRFGAGVFSYAQSSFGFEHSLIVPTVSYKAVATVVAIVPIAYQINSLSDISLPGKLSVGANIKYLYRSCSSANNLSTTELETFEIPYQYGTGFGVDLGAIYQFSKELNFGLQISDILTTKIDYSEFIDELHPWRSKDSFREEMKPYVTLGAAYFPRRWGGNVILAADIADVTGTEESLSESFWKKLHFGAEVKLFGFFAIRAGINSGYLTAGIGIEGKDTQLRYAYYGEERGKYAGQSDQWFHRIVLSVKTGGDKGKKFIPFKKSKKNKENEIKLGIKEDLSTDDIIEFEAEFK